MYVVLSIFKSLYHGIGGLKQQQVVATLVFIVDCETTRLDALLEFARTHGRTGQR